MRLTRKISRAVEKSSLAIQTPPGFVSKRRHSKKFSKHWLDAVKLDDIRVLADSGDGGGSDCSDCCGGNICMQYDNCNPSDREGNGYGCTASIEVVIGDLSGGDCGDNCGYSLNIDIYFGGQSVNNGNTWVAGHATGCVCVDGSGNAYVCITGGYADNPGGNILAWLTFGTIAEGVAVYCRAVDSMNPAAVAEADIFVSSCGDYE